MDKTNLFFWIVIILLIFISLGRIVVIRIKANPDASEEKKRKVDLIYNIVWCILMAGVLVAYIFLKQST